MRRLILAGLVWGVALAGCESGEDIKLSSESTEPKIKHDPVAQSILGGTVSLAGFVEANKIGNLSPERQTEAFRAFEERYQLASHLLQNEFAQNESARIRIAADVSKEVLDAYFDNFVEQAVTDTSVKAYFDAHPDQFVDRTLQVTALSLVNSAEAGSELDVVERSAEELDKLAQDPDASAIKRLETETIEQRSTHPDLWRQLASLSAGQWSKPVVTPRLVTHYRVETIKENPQKFDQVKAELRYRLQQEARKEEYQRLVLTRE